MMTLRVVLLLLLTLVGCDSSRNYANKRGNPRRTFAQRLYDLQRTLYATCVMEPDPNAPFTVTGTVDFMQTVTSMNYAAGPLHVSVRLQGFPAGDSEVKHGLHVHTFGNISTGCAAAGGHYNPLETVHGDRLSLVRHVGDFGNVLEDAEGNVYTDFTDAVASLVGDFSIFGRAMVIHEKRDDLGLGGNEASLANGNSGSRLACCIIAHASGSN